MTRSIKYARFCLWMTAIIMGIVLPAATAGDIPQFNTDKAWDYLIAQCRFGPRNPGSNGHTVCLDYLEYELRKYTGRVYLQPFTHYDKRLKTTFYMDNIIADFGEGDSPKIILCAHWDTRPRSDMDPDPANRHKPILGANDGASGVGVLLEMARLFSEIPPPVPVQIILFDGEDYGRVGENWDYLLGSKHFAKTANPADYRYAVLLDLIGDEDLEIKREYNSYKYCRDLQDKVWRIAEEVGSFQFSERMTHPIIDDHLSLIEIGIPAIDIIDLEFEYWHTQGDTPEHCRRESLKAVGKVLVRLIYIEEP